MMIKDRKGMIAFFDSMIFIVVIGLAVMLLFTNVQSDLEHVSAKDIHDDFFATELKVDDVFDVDDPRILPMQDIIAIDLHTGAGRIGTYITQVLRSLVPMSYGFTFECTLGNAYMKVSDRVGDVSFSYTAELDVITSGTLVTILTLH